MATAALTLLEAPDRVRLALSPLRRRLLERLREPASATQVAAELGLPRQRVNHHVRALERAGLVELVAERRRRGCVERVVAATADAFVVAPALIGAAAVRQDRHAAEHLVATAAGTVRDVSRMQAAAAAEGTRLLTFTLETEVRFSTPGDVERFASALAERVAAVVSEFDAPAGRAYRVVAGGHPSPRPEEEP